MKTCKLFFSVVILAATAPAYTMGGAGQDSSFFSDLVPLGHDSDLLLTDVYADPKLDELRELAPLPEVIPAAAFPFAQAPQAPAPQHQPAAQYFQYAMPHFPLSGVTQARQPSALQRNPAAQSFQYAGAHVPVAQALQQHPAAQSFQYQGPNAAPRLASPRVTQAPTLQQHPATQYPVQSYQHVSPDAAPNLQAHPSAQPMASLYQYDAPQLPVQEAPQALSLQRYSAPELQPMIPSYQGVAPRLPLQALTQAHALQPHSAAESMVSPYQEGAPDLSLPTSNRSSKKRKLPQEQKNHICPNPGCTYQTSHKGHFNEHTRTHSPETGIPCHECGSKFNNLSGLTRHMRTHTGAKPYKCDDCGHTCSQAANMRRHRATHEGIKPFACLVCRMPFSQKVHLQAHKCK